ncbi:MAG: class I SAM-dependent methyltransferase [Phycisphaerales bacterium]
MPKPSAKTRPPSPTPRAPTARTADRHALYEMAVQAPEVEIAFIDRVFRRRNGRLPTHLREDFCGTAWMACEWVKKRPTNHAVGLDLDRPTLAWGTARHVARLSSDQRRRLTLRRRNVLTPGPAKADVIAALNFSYWVFKERAVLARYFRACRRTLSPGGMLVLDLMGGADCHVVTSDRTRHKGFTYIWEHATVEPVSGHTTCKIHFEFRDGTRLRNAFVYDWRLWTIPELRDLLRECGFADVRAFWEGEDAHGRGSGIFREHARGTPDRSFVAYLVASPDQA